MANFEPFRCQFRGHVCQNTVCTFLPIKPVNFVRLYCKLTIRIRPVDFCFHQKYYLSFKFVYDHNNLLYLILQTIDVQMKDEYISCIFSSLLFDPRHRFVHKIIFIFLQVVLFIFSDV